jgi:hypothetical protein
MAGEALDIYASDLRPLILARRICVIAKVDIEHLIEDFKSVSGSLTASTFSAVLRKLLPEATIPAAAYEALVGALHPVFQLFANRAGAVDPVRHRSTSAGAVQRPQM